jgi:Tfp pilus assembly protein PilW
MNSQLQTEHRFRTNPSHARGYSLVELAVTLGVASIVLVVLGTLSSFGLQSFLVMGNSAALDNRSRLAADQMTRELRQATGVLRYDVLPESKLLRLTNRVEGYAVEYSWNADTRTVTCQKTDAPAIVCLTDCDTWDAAFFQNVTLASISQPYLPATNQAGILDLNQARIIAFSWTCSRPVALSKARTGNAHNLQVALRNTNRP